MLVSLLRKVIRSFVAYVVDLEKGHFWCKVRMSGLSNVYLDWNILARAIILQQFIFCSSSVRKCNEY